MCWILALAQVLAVLALWIAGGSGQLHPKPCPCSNLRMCEPLSAHHQHQVEVLLFDNGGMDYQHYDWSKITTIVINANIDAHILCIAHANKVRVVVKVGVTKDDIIHRDRREAWLPHSEQRVQALYMDGIYLDLQQVARAGSQLSHAITQLVNKTAHLLHLAIPGSRVIMNVPWSPTCPDGRCYDFVTLAKFCDFLLVLPSDFNREMGDDCFAKASVPYHQTYAGLAAYIRLGIDSRKLLTGVPWFGYDYPCKQFFEPGRCKLREHNFGGSRCSSSVAKPILYKQVMQLLSKSVTGRHWDENSESPYFVYKVNNTYHEVWYDDPESISLRSTIIRKLNLGGVCAWFGSSLNYSVNPIAAMQTEEMWNALRPIRRKLRI